MDLPKNPNTQPLVSQKNKNNIYLIVIILILIGIISALIEFIIFQRLEINNKQNTMISGTQNTSI